jgi:hypothetical protein
MILVAKVAGHHSKNSGSRDGCFLQPSHAAKQLEEFTRIARAIFAIE